MMTYTHKCALCGKAITDRDARFGPDCQARYDAALALLETSSAEVGEMLLTGDATTQRWLTKVADALIWHLRGWRLALRDARAFLGAARRAYTQIEQEEALAA